MENLRRENIQINGADYEYVWMPAVTAIHGFDYSLSSVQQDKEAGYSMDRLLGVSIEADYWSRGSSQDRPLPDDWREFLQKLAGPYGKTLLKMYQARYGVVCDAAA